MRLPLVCTPSYSLTRIPGGIQRSGATHVSASPIARTQVPSSFLQPCRPTPSSPASPFPTPTPRFTSLISLEPPGAKIRFHPLRSAGENVTKEVRWPPASCNDAFPSHAVKVLAMIPPCPSPKIPAGIVLEERTPPAPCPSAQRLRKKRARTPPSRGQMPASCTKLGNLPPL
jgi:hypothetical protein